MSLRVTIDINDEAKLAGLTFAREFHNARSEDQIETDEDYLRMVVDRALDSYAARAVDPIASRDKIIAEREARIAELESEHEDSEQAR